MTALDPLLFVYGTLRPGYDGPMARWLAYNGVHLGPAAVSGRLYRVADYPGLVTGAEGKVHGDLFALTDPVAALAILDAHEECTDAFPKPHEFRRVRLMVDGPRGQVEAWTYVFGWSTAGLEPIARGDFLCVNRRED